MPFRALDNRWKVLAVLCVGMLMVVLDSTVVMVALRSIQRDLGFSAANLAWPINAYLIAFGGTLLLAGRLADLVGARRVFGTGVIVFTAASLLCGLANSQWMLIASRFVQGLGGALASAVILAMIYTAFTEADERAKALSVFSFTASAGGSVGLLVGGTIAQALNWHWIFLVNVPIGIVTYVIARRIVPNAPGIGLREGADAFGAALLTSALMLAIYAVVEIPQSRAAWPTIVAAVVTISSMTAFVIRQARVDKPLLPLRIFKNPIVVWSNVLQIVVVSGFYAFFFLYSLYVRSVLHYDPAETGLAFLPLTLAIGAFSVGPSAWLMRRFGSRVPLVAGLAVAAAGLAAFALAPSSAPYATVALPAMTLAGIGLGVAFPCIMEFAMSSATPSDSGLISGLVNTTAEVGGAFGLAVIASIAASVSDGYHVAFSICTILVMAGAVLAAATFRPVRTSLPHVLGAMRLPDAKP